MESSLSDKEEGIMVCHRVVRIFEKEGITYYQTRGDAFFHKDRPITYNQIIGRVIKVERTEMSLARRILLSLTPITKRFILLNAAMVNSLLWIKRLADRRLL